MNDVSQVHTPILSAEGPPFHADCPQCGTKVTGKNGPVTGSITKVNKAILDHIEETADPSYVQPEPPAQRQVASESEGDPDIEAL